MGEDAEHRKGEAVAGQRGRGLSKIIALAIECPNIEHIRAPTRGKGQAEWLPTFRLDRAASVISRESRLREVRPISWRRKATP